MTSVALPRTPQRRVAAYVALTKPRIIELLLITTVPAMILAARGWPGLGLVLGTIGGGALSAGGANAINNVVDRDIDAQMRRTHLRPLPSATASPREALVLGLGLGIAGFGVLWWAANLVAAVLATAALSFYVLVYSIYLKRSTSQNIVIGGAAGAVPALVGWAAVTGGVDLPALVLFAVIFYWTPPHFWALALRFRADYARAGVPMLPVVVGEKATVRQIVLYSFVVVGTTLLLQPAAGLGTLYAIVAVLLGVALVVGAGSLAMGIISPLALFRFSNVYLALVFAAVALDALVGDPAASSEILAWVAGIIVSIAAVAILVDTRSDSWRELVLASVPTIGAVAMSVGVIAQF